MANHFRKAGVALRRKGTPGGEKRRIVIPNIAELISRYLAGESLKQLSDETGYSRPVLLRRFTEHNIPIRGRSDAEKVKWSKTKAIPGGIAKQCSAAWAACSSPVSDKPITYPEHFPPDLIARARGRFNAQSGIYPAERKVQRFLRKRGIKTVNQFPVGPYNLDLSLDAKPVAVEVCRESASIFNSVGPGHVTSEPQRIKYLLDHGWCLIYVMHHRRRIDLSFIGDHLVALLKRARVDESMFGQYGVLWCGGKAPPAARYNFNGLPFIPGFGACYE